MCVRGRKEECVGVCVCVYVQIFQLPYVLQHLQRYNAESKKNLIRHNTMARRRQALERTAGDTGSGASSDVSPLHTFSRTCILQGKGYSTWEWQRDTGARSDVRL